MLHKITLNSTMVTNIGRAKLDWVYLDRCMEHDPEISGVSRQPSPFYLAETKQVFLTLDRRLKSKIVLSKKTEELVLRLSNDIDTRSFHLVVEATACKRLERV